MEKQQRPVIVTVDCRYIHADKTETCITNSTEIVEVHEFTTQPAKVRRSYGFTFNQGNFESVRADVAIEVPCYLADVNKADLFATSFVNKRIESELVEAAALKKKREGRKSPL